MSARKQTQSSSELPEAQGDLRAEIELVRGLIREIGARLADETDDCAGPRSLNDLLRVLDGLGRAVSRLAGLLKAQRELDGAQSVGDAITRALGDVIQRLE